MGFPCGSAGKESACNAGDLGSIPGLILWRTEKLLTLVFWPGEFQGLDSPLGHKTRTWLSNFHFHFCLYFLGCPLHLTPTHINFVRLYIMKIFGREKNIINPQVSSSSFKDEDISSLYYVSSPKRLPQLVPHTLLAQEMSVPASSWRPVLLPKKPCPRACQTGSGASSFLLTPFCLPPQCHDGTTSICWCHTHAEFLFHASPWPELQRHQEDVDLNSGLRHSWANRVINHNYNSTSRHSAWMNWLPCIFIQLDLLTCLSCNLCFHLIKCLELPKWHWPHSSWPVHVHLSAWYADLAGVTSVGGWIIPCPKGIHILVP